MKNLKQRLFLSLPIALSLFLAACGGEKPVSQDLDALQESSRVESPQPSPTKEPEESEEPEEPGKDVSDKASPSPSAEAVSSSEDEAQEPVPTKTEKESEDPAGDGGQEKATPAPTAAPSAKPTTQPTPAQTAAPAPAQTPTAPPAQTPDPVPPATSQPGASESAPVQSAEHEHTWEMAYLIRMDYLGNCMYDQVTMMVCYGCGANMEDHYTTKIHHQWSEFEVVDEGVLPTCTEPGRGGLSIDHNYCDCGERNIDTIQDSRDQIIPPLGHSPGYKTYTMEIKQDENGKDLAHWYIYCGYCGMVMDEGWD